MQHKRRAHRAFRSPKAVRRGERPGQARSSSAVSALLCLALLLSGCAGEKDTSRYADAYRKLAAQSVRLAIRIEPLRASRLGFTQADSLLFTYSQTEAEDAAERLQSLEKQLAEMPAGRLSSAEVDRATVIINRLRGSRFALEILACGRSNPLIYVWAAEEALWAIPSRAVPPSEGELEAYRARIIRIPDLLSSGKENLGNTAAWHVRHAIERLDTLAAGLPRLALLLEKRYGATLERELGAANGAIRHFRAYASSTLLPASLGSIIIGSENLTKIFRYDEMIDSDPNSLIAESERQIERISKEKASLVKRIEHDKASRTHAATPSPASQANASFEARVARMLEELAALHGTAPGITRGREPILAFPAAPRYVSHSVTNPCYSIPIAPSATAAAMLLWGSAPPCRPLLAFSAAARGESDAVLRYALLNAAPRMLDPDSLRCASRDTVSAVFSSATFSEGWRYLVAQDLAQGIKRDDPEVYLLMLEERLRHYARLIAVLSLHAGTMTSESAIQYFAETLGIERSEAAHEVLSASVSPALAYPAVSMILIDEMLKNVSFVFDSNAPQRELAGILLASRDLPLPMIVPRTKQD